MQIVFHRDFKKRYKKLQRGERQKTDERLLVLEKEPFHPILNNHPLHYPYEGCRSINITGDLRAIYEHIGSHAVHFIRLGTHPELYG